VGGLVRLKEPDRQQQVLPILNQNYRWRKREDSLCYRIGVVSRMEVEPTASMLRLTSLLVLIPR
jgi:hypothetical protein